MQLSNCKLPKRVSLSSAVPHPTVRSTGEIVYHTAAVGVVLTQAENDQRFLVKHTDDIIAMAVHPDQVRTFLHSGAVKTPT